MGKRHGRKSRKYSRWEAGMDMIKICCICVKFSKKKLYIFKKASMLQ